MPVLGSIGTITGVFFGFAGAVLGGLGLLYGMRRDKRRDKQEDETTEIQLRFQSKDLARDEAMALADTRGKAIEDLEAAIAKLREEMARDKKEHLETVDRLQSALDLVRDQAFETQQMFAHGVRALLITLLGDLDRDPPLVEVAVHRIREALADTEPAPPGQRPAI